MLITEYIRACMIYWKESIENLLAENMLIVLTFKIGEHAITRNGKK